MDGTARLFLLGAMRVERDGRDLMLAGAQPRLVLVHAALRRGDAVPAEVLADDLWPAGPARHWEGALRGVVAKVRAFIGELGPGVASLENVGRSYRFEVADDELVDVWRAEACLVRAERAIDGDDRAEAARRAGEAVDLLGGELLPGIDAGWLTPWRTRVGSDRCRALRVAATADGMLGHHGDAVTRAREAVAADPIDEESHRCLMTALALAGNRAAAIRSYGRCRSLLADELGIAPSAATEDLYLSILTAEPNRGTDPPVVAAGRSPRRVLPPPVDRPFVGRRAELAALDRAWQAARGGSRQVVLLHGDAGVGKTRVALEAVRNLTPDLVLYGSASPEQVIPFEPFAEALDRHLAGLDRHELTRLAGPFAPELAALVPSIADRLPVRPAFGASASRSRIFEAARAVLRRVASVPTILVLDDLQWADEPSLLLARHLLRTLDGTRLLVIATYRDDGERTSHLAETIAALHRLDGCDALRVGGLEVADVVQLLRAAHVPDAEERGTVLHHRTAGNGFYVSQVLAAAANRPELVDPTAVPETVVDLVRIRVADLSAPAHDLLGAAAVLGTTFPSSLLESVASSSLQTFDAALEELIDHRLVFETEDGDLSFAHAIVRDAVWGQLTRGRRRRLHLRAARATESSKVVDFELMMVVDAPP